MPIDCRDGVYIGAMLDGITDRLFEIASSIRTTTKAKIEYEKKSLKAHLKNSDKINAKYCIVVGEDELKDNKIWVKNLDNKEQFIISLDEFLEEVK